MIHLTQKEKADRYDSLQTALEYTIKRYKERQKECEGRYGSADVIGAYNKGQADTYKTIIEDMETWKG